MSYLGKRKSGGAPLLSGKKRLVYRAPSKMAAMSSRYNRYAKGLNRRGVMSKESGFVDLAAATYACNSTGSITLIATVAQGTSVNQRVGKKIQWKSMQIRGTVQANPTTVSNNSAWLIVYDRRPTGSLPAITDVLSSATAISFTNDANSGRFQILKRWNDTILGNVGTAGQQTDKTSIVVDEFLSLRSLPCAYKAAGTGAIGDIEQGALYLITVGDNAAGNTDSDAILAFRTRFLDV